MPFTPLDLDPTDEYDRAGRALWIVKQVEGKDFRWFQSETGWFCEVLVPEGYQTNFASIPRFFQRVLPPDGPYRRATIIHDAMYDAGAPSRWLADAVFYEAMCELNVPLWKRAIMWLFVRLFASRAYDPRKKRSLPESSSE